MDKVRNIVFLRDFKEDSVHTNTIFKKMLRIQIFENENDETNGKFTPEFTHWEAAATAALKILSGITSA